MTDKEFTKARYADIEFKLLTSLCLMCKNKQIEVWNPDTPEMDMITCRILGKVPEDIVKYKVFECDYLDLDLEDPYFEINKSLVESTVDYMKSQG